jgi:hypothetical protein
MRKPDLRRQPTIPVALLPPGHLLFIGFDSRFLCIRYAADGPCDLSGRNLAAGRYPFGSWQTNVFGCSASDSDKGALQGLNANWVSTLQRVLGPGGKRQSPAALSSKPGLRKS